MKTIINAVRSWTRKEIKDNIKDSVANWNQNDSSAPDYVKNRTHWSDGIVEEVILERQTVTNGSHIEYSLTAGHIYKVIWDGEPYTCTAWDSGGKVCLGDGGFWEIPAGEPAPFIIANNVVQCAGDSNAEHTIRITRTVENIHKLDSKYLDIPTNLATTDDVQEALDLANTAQDTAETAVTNAASAQAAADKIQTDMDLPYHYTWKRSSGIGFTETITIDGRTFTRRFYRPQAQLDGLTGGKYMFFKKRDGSISYSGYSELICEKNFWRTDDFGIVYNRENIPIIITVPNPNTYVKGVLVSAAGVYTYDEDDSYVDTIQMYNTYATLSDTLLSKFRKLCGFHTIEGNPFIIKSSTEGSTKKFKITVDDSGVITATEI